jgi:hypothetical protein
MPRTILEEARLHPAIRETVANLNADIVHNVQAAATSNPVLVVGMVGNPHVRRARKVLDAAGIAYHYLEYGSYFGGWRRRIEGIPDRGTDGGSARRRSSRGRAHRVDGG